MASRPEPSVRDAKTRILDAAANVLARRGYHDTNVEEIVTRSGTSKGSVYFHFPSKENLFLAVMDQMSKRLHSRVRREVEQLTDPVQRLETALETTLRTLCKHKTLARLLLIKGPSIGPSFARKRQESLTGLADMTAQLIRETSPRDPSVDAEVAAHAWLGAVSEIVVRWLQTGKPDPINTALPTLKVMLRRGLGLPPAMELAS